MTKLLVYSYWVTKLSSLVVWLSANQITITDHSTPPFTLPYIIYEQFLLLQVKVFWVVTLCSIVVEYQCFREPCCLHLQALKLVWNILLHINNYIHGDHTRTSRLHLTKFKVMGRWRQQGPSKCWYPTTTLCGVTTQETSTWIFTNVKTSNLTILDTHP
jgi:hypothetical protein